MRTTATGLATAALLLGGCDRVPAEALTRCEERVVRGAASTDVLFVIDDSGSMSEEQANVRANLATFIDRLENGPVENDFQIGVTNTSVEDFDPARTLYTAGPNVSDRPTGFGPVPFPAGALVAVDPASIDPSDAQPDGGLYLYDPALAAANPLAGFTGTRILRQGSPSLVQDFMANVLVGIDGTGKEQPFRAARLAVSDRIADGVNAGFLRPGARLAIVFISDEDDCSDTATPRLATSNDACHDPAVKAGLDPSAADLAAFLRGPIDGELRDVVVGVIAGVNPTTLAPSCETCADRACATAYDGADRYEELVNALGGLRTRLDSVCAPSFADSLAAIAELLVPQTLTLEGAPADYRLLSVAVDRASGGGRVSCAVALEGDPAASSADAVYTPSADGRLPALTFQNACRLSQGDAVDLRVVCAG